MPLGSGMLPYFSTPWAPPGAPLPLVLLWHRVQMFRAGCVWCVHVSVHKGIEDSTTWNAPHSIANDPQSDYLGGTCSTFPEYSLVPTPNPQSGKNCPWTKMNNDRECQGISLGLIPHLRYHITIAPQCQLYFWPIQTVSKDSPQAGKRLFSFSYSGSSFITWHCWSRSSMKSSLEFRPCYHWTHSLKRLITLH